MPVMQQLPEDHPLMIAWEEHKKSDAFTNSDRWARFVGFHDIEDGRTVIDHPHLDGSLWAMFSAGWDAALIHESENNA